MAKSYKQSEHQQGEETSQQSVQSPYPPGFKPRVQAAKLYEAMSGMGTDERAIFNVLQSGRSDLNRAIESAFNQMYPRWTLRYWLKDELGGSDYTKAMQLLGRGDFTLAQKLQQAADGWGADEEKIFHALETASAEDIAEVNRDASLKRRLYEELGDADWALATAFLNGHGTLAKKLRHAVAGWGTDEDEIWRALQKAPANERQFVLDHPTLLQDVEADLSGADFLRVKRMLAGTWDNLDKIEVALKGIGTDEATLITALSQMTFAEYDKLQKGTEEMPNGVASLKAWLISDLSGETEFEALESLHQVQMAHDPGYGLAYREAQAEKLGEDAMKEEGSKALIATNGQSMSPVARLRQACVGMGTDEDSVWDVAASISATQGRWILFHNPDNVLGVLRSDLSHAEYLRVREALGGGALGRIQVLRNAVEGIGTDEAQIYHALESILAEGVGKEVLADAAIMRSIRSDIDPQQNIIFEEALRYGQFTPLMRLRWATEGAGTDEDLVWQVCAEYGAEWADGDGIRSDVDAILLSELATRDYWRARDLIRGEPSTEQGKLERAKELLERERSSGLTNEVTGWFSDSGSNADDAWRDYQVTYNQAYEDGKVSEEEQTRLSEAEDYSRYTTEQYREAKASFAQWASQIAITIVGIVATILTAGAGAGGFIAALSANAGKIAGSMVMAAAMKVGIHKAIEGEGYDLDSMDTLVDGVGAAIEGGLFIVGNIGAAKMMQGLSKSRYAASVGPTIEKTFGPAGKRIMAGGLEGSMDGTIGGMGEGLFRGLAEDKAWTGGVGNLFSSVGTTTALHGGLGGSVGFGGGALFRSLGEQFGPAVRRALASRKAAPEAPSTGSVDDIMQKMPDDLETSAIDQRRLTEAAFETNQRMQVISDEISAQFGLPPSKVGLKGNKFGVDDVGKLDQDEFIGKVLEKQRRWGDPEKIGKMTDMSRGRFDVDSFEEATAIADTLERQLNQAFGAENVTRKKLRDVYKRYHILVKDPATGVHHEWQIGTEALTRMIEKVSVMLPDGVVLHGTDFHVVMYDVLDKLSDPKIRAQHGLPDNIADDIGLSGIRKRYDQLMLEAGTVPKGSKHPTDFDKRLARMAEELGGAVDTLEKKYPGLATKLDTKLTAEKASKAANHSETEGPVQHPEMPAQVDTKASSAPKVQEQPQPKLRPDHEGSAEYRIYKNAVAFMNDGKIDPHSAKQGSLGDCYLLAGCAAEARANPAGIKKLIKDNGDGTFDVTLYMRENWYAPAQPKTVKIDAQFPSRGGNPIYAKVGRSSGSEDEMWMPLLEKALAQETGSFDLISGGNINKHVNFGGVHELLTGQKVRFVNTEMVSADDLLERISDALASKEPISAGTFNFNEDAAARAAAERLNIYGNHAYSIESVDLDARTVNLQNPWGSRHPTNISIEDFQTYYKRLDIGTLAKADGSVRGGAQFEGAGEVFDQIGDNVAMTIARAQGNLTTSLTSSEARSSASAELKQTNLKYSQLEFPSEDIRQFYWSFLTSKWMVKFEGEFEGNTAAFFVDVATGTTVVTDLDGGFISGVSLHPQALQELLETGML